MPHVFMSTPNGPRVRELRRDRRWTQTELGRKVGRKKSVISKAESGLPVSVTLMRQIAGVFRVDLAEIEITAEDIPGDRVLQQAG